MYCRGLFVVATLLLSSLGVSQESAALSPSDKQSIDALLTDYVQAFMAKEGGQPVGSSPEELTQMFKREVAKYAKVIEAGHIVVQ